MNENYQEDEEQKQYLEYCAYDLSDGTQGYCEGRYGPDGEVGWSYFEADVDGHCLTFSPDGRLFWPPDGRLFWPPQTNGFDQEVEVFVESSAPDVEIVRAAVLKIADRIPQVSLTPADIPEHLRNLSDPKVRCQLIAMAHDSPSKRVKLPLGAQGHVSVNVGKNVPDALAQTLLHKIATRMTVGDEGLGLRRPAQLRPGDQQLEVLEVLMKLDGKDSHYCRVRGVY